MKTNRMRSQIYWLLALTVSIPGTTRYVFAGSEYPFDFEENQSFLANTQIGTNSNAELNASLENKLYGTSLSNRLELEYQDLNRDFDMRERYGLNSSFAEADHQHKTSQFGRYVMRHAFSYQVTEGLKKAEKVSSEGRAIKRTHDTIQNIVQNSTKVEFSPEFKMGTKTDLPHQRGQLWVRSTFFDADLNAVAGKTFEFTPRAETSGSSATNSDRLYLNMSRDLGVFGLQSAMSYGFETTRMNHSVSKLLLPNLSAELATTRGLNSGKAGMAKSEESVRMTYGLKF
jgi:hypothetical protein